MIEAALLIAGYFVGAIPVGYLIARAHGIDIFKVGSGNVGATNIKRALGMGWALAVFILDVAKGAIPALAGRLLLDSQPWAMTVGAAAILGHCLSPFLHFKGGKGISTTLGVALATAPLVALSAFGLWIVLLAITRYVSIASLVAVPSGLLFSWIYRESAVLYVFYGAVSLFVYVRHRGNFIRLRNGTEPKFDFRDKRKPSDDDPSQQKDEDRREMRLAARSAVSRRQPHA